MNDGRVPQRLRVRVNTDLVLDAGATDDGGRSEQVIFPPKATLFRQVVEYLRSRPDKQTVARGSTEEQEGIATAAVVLRWGTYLAVLADRDKPVWAGAKATGTSRVSDSEMARINIEASAALAEWIDISRGDRGLYEQLVARALELLPLPKVRPRSEGSSFVMLAMPDVAARIAAGADATSVAKVRADAERNPSRIFANALVNVAWRSGPVEDIHAGEFRGYPLDQRRVTVAEEAALVSAAADQLMTGMDVCRQLAMERLGRPWSEQVLPYALASSMGITPTGWTLTEATREIRLPNQERRP